MKIFKLKYNTIFIWWRFKRLLLKIAHYQMFKRPTLYIPKNTPYCYDDGKTCPFHRCVKALPHQQNGYCMYTNEFDIINNIKINKESKIMYSKDENDIDKSVADILGELFPSSLIWDECKECNIQ